MLSAMYRFLGFQIETIWYQLFIILEFSSDVYSPRLPSVKKAKQKMQYVGSTSPKKLFFYTSFIIEMCTGWILNKQKRLEMETAQV